MPSNPDTLLPQPLRIVFMGTPDFAVPSLQALLDREDPVLSVVTQPDRPRGRGRKLAPSPVKQLALGRGIEVLQPEKASDPEFCEELKARRPDLIVVVAYGQILRQRVLDIPPRGIVNIHASLLPKYRGAAPIPWAILNREEKTGLTAMQMVAELDAGPILLQEETTIGPKETVGELHDRLAQRSGPFVHALLHRIKEGATQPRPQNPDAVTFAPKLDPEQFQIRWTESAPRIAARIRALDPWPGAYTHFNGRKIKLFSARIPPEAGPDAPAVPGRVLSARGDGLWVETAGGIVEIRKLQAPGRKRLGAAEFLKGFPIPEGTVLGV